MQYDPDKIITAPSAAVPIMIWRPTILGRTFKETIRGGDTETCARLGGLNGG